MKMLQDVIDPEAIILSDLQARKMPDSYAHVFVDFSSRIWGSLEPLVKEVDDPVPAMPRGYQVDANCIAAMD